MSVNKVITDIVAGEYDNDMGRIIKAVNDRRDIIGRIKTSSITVGDVIKFNNNIRPKYLAGGTVTVKKVNRKTVVCDFPSDSIFGRFANAKNVKVPTSTIDVVE